MTSYVPIKLAFEVTEPEERTNLNDLIFIHRLSLSSIAWKTLTKKCVDYTGRRAYALDMRNHGDSEWSEDFSIDIMVKDVLNFMDEKGIKQAALIGQSMGAKVSMDLALAQPERVEKIILEDLGPDSLPESIIQMVAGYLALMIKQTEMLPPDASYQEAKRILFDSFLETIPEDSPDKLRLMELGPEILDLPLTKKNGRYVSKSNINFLQKWVQTQDSFRASKGLCTKPALFIYGTLSQFKANEEEELIMKLFPNAKLHAIEGATHGVHNECPDEFCQVVLKFLNES